MKKWPVAAVALTALPFLAVPARAQETPAPSNPTPRAELFVGYGGHIALGETDRYGGRWHGRGASLGLDWNFNENVALVLKGTSLAFGNSGTGSWVNYGFLVGPRFRFRSDRRVKPFVQFTAGVDHGPVFRETIPLTPFEAREQRTSFQAAIGGGLDVALNRRIAWRAIQVEERSVFGDVSEKHRLAVSSGLVFSFGRK